MVKSFCKAEDFQQITNIKEGINLVRFDMEPIMQEIYIDGQPTGDWEESGYVKYTEAYVTGNITIEKLKEIRLEALKQYDESEDINSLFVNGKRMWFDKVTRTCIVYSMQTEKANGAAQTVLYDNDDIPYTLPIDVALQMFGALELYAKSCYNVTAQHAADIKSLDSIQQLLDYKTKIGYPKKLNFELSQ